MKKDFSSIAAKIKQNTVFNTPFGIVISVEKNIANIIGLNNVFFYEVVKFENGVRGLVVAIEREFINVAFLSNETVDPNTKVYGTGETFCVSLGEQLIGKVLNGYGENKNIDSKDLLHKRPIEIDCLQITDIEKVKSQVITGVALIDWFCAVGFGQREAVICPRGVEEDIIIKYTMINLKERKKTLFIYCGIGQRIDYPSTLFEFIKQNNIDNFIFVIANSSSDLMMRNLAPFVACTIAEYFRDLEYDVIVFFHDLTEHAMAHRELALTIGSTVGREAYPPDITYVHSRLLERFAKMKKGSMTCFPFAMLGVGDDMAGGYIPTNIMSITDGQIIFNGDKFNRGHKPAIEIGLSVSRVGSEIQNPYMRKLCGSLKLKMSYAEKLEESRKFGANLDENDKQLLNLYEKMNSFLNQTKPYPLFLHILILYALTHNYCIKDHNAFIETALTYKNYEEKITKGDEEVILNIINTIQAGL